MRIFRRTRVLIVRVGVRRPDWWPYPARCATGHEWGPDRVLVVWQRCLCPGAQTLHPDEAIWGHFVVSCREPGWRSVWYDPRRMSRATRSASSNNPQSGQRTELHVAFTTPVDAPAVCPRRPDTLALLPGCALPVSHLAL